MKIEKDLLEQFNLPSYIGNSSFAEASEKIKSKFLASKGGKVDVMRQDKASRETMEELLTRLSEAQEYVKMQEALKNESQQIPDQMDGQIPEGMEEFAGGGFMNFLGNNGGAMMGAGQAVGVAGQAAAGEDSVIAGDADDNAMVDSTKDTIAGAIGPIGQAFRGIQKAGQGIGNAIGGDTGAVVSGLFSPEESTIANFKDKDLNLGQKLLGTIPGVGAVIAKKSAEKKADKIALDTVVGQSKQVAGTDFAYGGKTNKYVNGGVPASWRETFGVNTNNLVDTKVQAPNFEPTLAGDITPVQDRPRPQILNRGLDWLGQNASNIAQYAPVASNLLELSKLKPSETQRGSRVGTTYRPQQFDEASLVNQVNQQNLERSLTESSGGDLGALRSNLIGAGAAKIRALSEGMAKGQQINRDENRFKFQSDLNREAINVELDRDYLDRAAKDKAAYETTKSGLKRALAEDIGAIGREEVDKKIVKDLFGYKWNGKYYIDEKGKKVPTADVQKKLKDLKEKEDNSTARLYKRRNSNIKSALDFRLPKDTRLT